MLRSLYIFTFLFMFVTLVQGINNEKDVPFNFNDKVSGKFTKYEKNGIKYISYNFKTPILAKLVMHNKMALIVRYVKKIEKYKDNVLQSISYYEEISYQKQKKTKLTVRVFYYQQKIVGFKKREYKAQKLHKEEYYNGNQFWAHYYNKYEKLQYSYYYPPNSRAFLYSVYEYDSDQNLNSKKDFYPNKKIKKRFWFFRKDGTIEKIEYYKDNTINLVEKFNEEGLLEESLDYDRAGDRILDE